MLDQLSCTVWIHDCACVNSPLHCLCEFATVPVCVNSPICLCEFTTVPVCVNLPLYVCEFTTMPVWIYHCTACMNSQLCLRGTVDSPMYLCERVHHCACVNLPLYCLCGFATAPVCEFPTVPVVWVHHCTIYVKSPLCLWEFTTVLCEFTTILVDFMNNRLLMYMCCTVKYEESKKSARFRSK